MGTSRDKDLMGRNGSGMTDEEEIHEEEAHVPVGAGQRLREAREQAGMDIAQVAAETRIPERHLIVIEAGDFNALPARTYAVGFSRSYARLVGLDEKEIASQVRAELAAASNDGDARPSKLEPGDPARVPSRGLAWAAVAAAVLLVAGGIAFYRSYLVPGAGPGSLLEQERIAQAQQAAEAQAEAEQKAALAAKPEALDPDGEVVFTALEEGIWVKFYDRNGRQLMQKQMAKGESYAIPAEANGPQIWTGRPDAFSITVGGSKIPKLAEEERTIRDVKIDGASLLARADISSAQPAEAAATVDNPAT